MFGIRDGVLFLLILGLMSHLLSQTHFFKQFVSSFSLSVFLIAAFFYIRRIE